MLKLVACSSRNAVEANYRSRRPSVNVEPELDRILIGDGATVCSGIRDLFVLVRWRLRILRWRPVRPQRGAIDRRRA